MILRFSAYLVCNPAHGDLAVRILHVIEHRAPDGLANLQLDRLTVLDRDLFGSVAMSVKARLANEDLDSTAQSL